ncbi:hypothetical protein BDI4_690010 [Burkholderia diffusa]|nr:hypothetical protein BDI4_690010 [Burkholderia diffusa]
MACACESCAHIKSANAMDACRMGFFIFHHSLRKYESEKQGDNANE